MELDLAPDFKVHCGEGLFDDASGNPVTTISLGDGPEQKGLVVTVIFGAT